MTHPTPSSFGEDAAEMVNETEVEASIDGVTVEPGRTTPGPAAADQQSEVADAAEGADVLASAEEDAAKTQADVAALTADLQRLQAEYVNYKRRVDRDRQLVAENAAYRALVPVLEVLDTVDLARQAGELEGGFKAVADQLERAVGSSGLSRFGAPGEAFDPNLHEALSHLGEDPEVEVTTVKLVAKSGYRMGERVVRAAQVLVIDPASNAPEAPEEAAD